MILIYYYDQSLRSIEEQRKNYFPIDSNEFPIDKLFQLYKLQLRSHKTNIMIPLKQATSEKHKIAERMPFNVKMFKGELSKSEYLNYLVQQLELFKTIESKGIPHPDLSRVNALIFDIQELAIQQLTIPPILKATQNYSHYLNSLNPETILPHVYLHFLAVMFGGQMIKSKVPSTGKFYEFNSPTEAMQTIRELQSDLWADEVNLGFDFTIEIFKELELPIDLNKDSHLLQATTNL